MENIIHAIQSPEQIAIEQLLTVNGDRNKVERIVKELTEYAYEQGFRHCESAYEI